MVVSTRKIPILVLACALAAASLLAADEPPLLPNGSNVPNWTVPPYRQSGTDGGLKTMGDGSDLTPGIAFVARTPCRVFDTRNPIGPYGGPRLIANVTRNFDINDGPCSGIPLFVGAYSMNFGAILPDGSNSFVTIWPAGLPQPLVSSINPIQGAVVANAAIVPAGLNGTISIFPNTGLHLYGDINGYFTASFVNDNFFRVAVTSTSFAIFASNSHPFCEGVCGIYATTSSGTAIEGDALEANAEENHGVFGVAFSSHPYTSGVFGRALNAAAAGGLFDNTGAGMIGSNAVLLATQVGGVNYSVFSASRILGGSLVISGLPKSFAAPHPEDPGLEIRYASIEGPTVDVYFRGSGELVNGIARIEIPDHFRFTARDGTYMTTLTPVGRAIALTVESEGPEGIVVRGSGSARFHYVVYAERAEVVGFQPVIPNETFTPAALAKGDRLSALPESTKALLIRNGTLNPDGRTFNLQTAEVQGWTVPPARTDPAAQRPAPHPSP
jgi:hypothetical protein